MLNLSISADNKHLLKSALENPHKVAREYDEGKIENLEMSINNDDGNIYNCSNVITSLKYVLHNVYKRDNTFTL